MNKNKIWSLLGVLTVLAMLVSACAPAATAAPTSAPATQAPVATATSLEVTPQGKKILHVAYSGEIDVLNAETSQNLTDIEVTMVEGLIISNDKNQYIPVLAKEIPTYDNGGIVKRADGKIDMTWHLQQGVKWHDGVEFTSHDVCFTWNYIVGEPQVYNQDQYLNIDSCKEVDKYTVLFTWKGPYAPYNTLFEAILPAHLFVGMTPTQVTSNEAYNRSPIGTGPFKFAEWKSGEYIRVVKNPDYWRPGYPKLDEIIFNFTPDVNTRLNAMKSKEDELGIGFQANQVKDLKAIDGYTTDLVASNTYMLFGTSTKSANGKLLFSDPNVRKAMYYAIDRQSIATDLMEGTVTVATTPINPVSPFYNPKTTVYNFDPAKSKQLLADAGWVPGSDGILVADHVKDVPKGTRFSFTFLNRGGRAAAISIAQVIQAELKDVGIEALQETKESAAWTAQWRTGDWDAVVAGWFLTADPGVTTEYACKGANNMTGYCDPKLDDLMNQADATLDFTTRKGLMDQVQAMMADDAFDLPLYFSPAIYTFSNKLVNFKGSGTNLGSFWNDYEWDLTP